MGKPIPIIRARPIVWTTAQTGELAVIDGEVVHRGSMRQAELCAFNQQLIGGAPVSVHTDARLTLAGWSLHASQAAQQKPNRAAQVDRPTRRSR